VHQQKTRVISTGVDLLGSHIPDPPHTNHLLTKTK
jgi:hypothetical protein